MKCKNCGIKFDEGIFCPECGTKNISEGEKVSTSITEEKIEATKVQEEVAKAKEEAERAKAEAEKIKAEAEQAKAEAKRVQEEIEKVKAEAKREKAEAEKVKAEVEKNKKEQANLEKEDLLNRTVRGTVYKTIDEAGQAKREHNMLDDLINQLMVIKSQKKRQEKFSEFTTEIKTMDAKQRYELLKEKVSRRKPLAETINAIWGYSILVAFIAWIVGALNDVDVETSAWLLFMFVWYLFGFWGWFIWRIVLFIKSKSKNYYKNIKNI